MMLEIYADVTTDWRLRYVVYQISDSLFEIFVHDTNINLSYKQGFEGTLEECIDKINQIK